MSSGADLHVMYRVANALIQPYPFPHFYVRDVFPEDYYRELRAQLPPAESYEDLRDMGRVGSGYPDGRLVMPLIPDRVESFPGPMRQFWEDMAHWLFGEFGAMLLSKFEIHLNQRLGNSRKMQFRQEALIVQDYTRYSLGPHTDSPKKVMSLLFYLPPDDSLAHLGTSIYRPKDPTFTCVGGPHHEFELFDRMVTMPFLPNTLFAFLKTSNSFHGVEPISEEGVRRDLLLFDIKIDNPPELQRQQPAYAQPGASPPSNFTF